MLKSLTFGGSLILIATTGFAQQQMQAQPVQGNLKNAGVYNLATGTWSRGNTLAGAADRLYNNNANTGFFGVMGIAADLIWTDEGRIPSSNADSVTINVMQTAYCSSVAGAQNGGIIFYESYTSCTDILALTPTAAFGFSVPGNGGGSTACWLVTFDITGTSLAFCMAADGDGTFDGTSALDNFGWTIVLNDQGAGGFNGPFLNGDPNNYAYGDGTKYQNSGAAYGTGLGTVDQFWLTDPSLSYANGCYWFGGYTGGNPFASFWLVLDGDKDCGGNDYPKFCSANNNSTGAPADLTGSGGTSASSGTITMTSAPVPNQPGIFFHAANQNSIPFGCSFLCATGGTVRGSVTGGVANVATYTYDNSDAKHTISTLGTRSFQYWYRDPMNAGNCAGGATFNTSNGVTGTITP